MQANIEFSAFLLQLEFERGQNRANFVIETHIEDELLPKEQEAEAEAVESMRKKIKSIFSNLKAVKRTQRGKSHKNKKMNQIRSTELITEENQTSAFLNLRRRRTVQRSSPEFEHLRSA